MTRALTESHAGVEVLTASVVTPSGRPFFIPGDSVVLSLMVRNILPQPAPNLQFTVTSSDAALQPLSGTITVSSLAQNAQAVLPPMVMKVGAVSPNRTSSIAVRWVSNGNERDARAYKVYLFSAIPRWLLQLTPAAVSLFSIRAVSPRIAWASGGDGNATAPAVVRTIDGGQTWSDVTGGLSGVDLYTVFAVDELRAFEERT